MAYTLMIGEMFVDICHEDRSARVSVYSIDGTPLGAPLDPTGGGTRGNENYPGYLQWRDAMKTLGLYEVFYGDTPDGLHWEGLPSILGRHPGAVALVQAHAAAFDAALERLKGQIQDGRVETFSVLSQEPGNRVTWTSRPSTPDEVECLLLRAEWLSWWTRRALRDCHYPTFANW